MTAATLMAPPTPASGVSVKVVAVRPPEDLVIGAFTLIVPVSAPTPAVVIVTLVFTNRVLI